MVKQEKGVMWTVEAFLALLILLILVPAYMPDAPEGQNWPEFSDQVTAEDITYTLHETGLADENVDRGYTGNIEAAANTYSNNRLEVSGELKGVPSETLDIGFHVLDSEIEERNIDTLDQEQSSQHCSEDDLENLHDENSDPDAEEIYVTEYNQGETEPDGFFGNLHQHAYFIPPDSEGEYDRFWIMNEDCNSAEGPYLKKDFFNWGTALLVGNRHFQAASWNMEEEKFTTYKSLDFYDIVSELRSSDNVPRNDVKVSTFNSSIDNFNEDLSNLNAMVLRTETSIGELGIDSMSESELENYFNDRGLILMMSPDDSTIENDLNFTGLEAGSGGGGGSLSFTEYQPSETAENFFRQTEESLSGTMLGGNSFDSGNEHLPENGALLHGDGNADQNDVISFRGPMSNETAGSVAALNAPGAFSMEFSSNPELISSTILVTSDPDNSFGDANGEIVTRTAIPGQLEGETLTPYRLELRWFQ